MDRDDTYAYDPEEKQETFERFDLRPASPDDIRGRLADGDSVEVVDIPESLGRHLAVEPETGTALYRLVQLFGTPNVPVGVAGGRQHDRYATTWMFAFDVTYDAPASEDVPTSFTLAVYDYQTDVSTGVLSWNQDGEGTVREPAGPAEGADPLDLPDEFAETVVQLVLSTVEEPVPATYENVWI